MGYIQELRRYVGNRPLIMVGAAVLVMDQQGRLLLLKRADNGLWGLPGGGMEPGESLEDTAKRETKEETGLAVEELTLFDVYSGAELYYRYPNGAEVYNVTVVYQVKYANGDIQIDPQEHTDYSYFEITQLPVDLSPPIRPVLEDLVRKLGVL
jgi:8-oxo-dGTP pyrophosphatase MutT (NUDIX family)